MNTFKFVGKIKKLEEKNGKKFIDTKACNDGWTLEKVKFRVACEDTTEFLDLVSGKYDVDSRNTVFTQFFKDGDKNEVENAKVEWAKRFDPEIIDKVPSYKKYKIDLASDKIRETLMNEKKEAEASALLDKKYVFISQYDFTMKIRELLQSGAFGDDNYVITGTVDYSFSVKNNSGVYYRSFTPTNIYKAPDDEQTGCFGKFDLFYCQDEVVDEAQSDGSIPVNGYVQYYDRMGKKNYFADTTLKIDNANPMKDGLARALTQLGDPNAEVLVMGVNVRFFNGSPKTEIKDEDLSETQKLLIEWGLKTKEEIISEMGGTVYGDRVNCIYLDQISRGYANGPKKTDYTKEDLLATPTNNGAKPTLGNKSPKVDLFDDDTI